MERGVYRNRLMFQWFKSHVEVNMPRTTSPPNSDVLIQHLVDPADWVADHERCLCYVCTRTFGAFRRKHHCRMCGEVVCSNCTLHKNAMLPSIGQTRVRVCISCLFTHTHSQKMSTSYSPQSASPTEQSQEWVRSHLHSPPSGRNELEEEEPEAELLRQLRNYQDSYCTSDGGSIGGLSVFAHTNRFDSRTDESNQRKESVAVSKEEDEDEWMHPWPKPPMTDDEPERLQALMNLQILDTAPEKPFDMICELAKARLGCPMAAVSFLDEHRQWFKATAGLAHKVIPRKISLCAHVIPLKESIAVLDTLQDERFATNPLVLGAAEVRFYASAPILDPTTGHAVGSVFVLDTRPRESCFLAILERLARAAAESLPRPKDLEEKAPAKNKTCKLDECASIAPTSSMPSVMSSASNSSLVTSSQAPQSNQEETRLAASKAGMGEQMEVLLMKLLTQNTETQQQLAAQQIELSNTIGEHSTQLNKLMTDVARMEAKIDRRVLRQ